jgi:DNA modification methylase
MNEIVIDTIHNIDCLEGMRSLPGASVDIVLTSPPYNILHTTGNFFSSIRPASKRWKNCPIKQGYDTYSDDMPHEEYVRWQRECLTEMMRLLKEDGAIFYNHKWRVQNGLIQDRSDILSGFPVRQVIIWRRNGGVNFNESFFLPTYEVIYLIAKPKFKLSAGANRHGDVWFFPAEQNNEHPAAFPIKLAERIISSCSGQVILDPFIGSGTTAVAAYRHKRNFIGMEISEKYCKMANERLDKERRKGTNRTQLVDFVQEDKGGLQDV